VVTGRTGEAGESGLNPRTETSERISRGGASSEGGAQVVGWLVCNAAGGLSLSDRGGSGEGEGDKKEAHSLRKVRGRRHCGSISEGAVITGLER